MTLKELRIAPEHKIRIRTEDGSNFIFIGMAGEVDFESRPVWGGWIEIVRRTMSRICCTDVPPRVGRVD